MSKTIHSPKLKMKIVLTDAQEKEYLKAVEEQRQKTINQNTLSKQLAEPTRIILEKTLLKKENNEFMDTVESLLIEREKNAEELKQWATSSHTNRLSNIVKTLEEIDQKIKTLKDAYHSIYREITYNEISKMEKIHYVDPSEFLTEAKLQELSQ